MVGHRLEAVAARPARLPMSLLRHPPGVEAAVAAARRKRRQQEADELQLSCATIRAKTASFGGLPGAAFVYRMRPIMFLQSHNISVARFLLRADKNHCRDDAKRHGDTLRRRVKSVLGNVLLLAVVCGCTMSLVEMAAADDPTYGSQPTGIGEAAASKLPAKFEELHRTIKPQPDEAQYAQVPWISTIAEARKKAAEEGKPLFIWYMVGEPLGQC